MSKFNSTPIFLTLALCHCAPVKNRTDPLESTSLESFFARPDQLSCWEIKDAYEKGSDVIDEDPYQNSRKLETLKFESPHSLGYLYYQGPGYVGERTHSPLGFIYNDQLSKNRVKVIGWYTINPPDKNPKEAPFNCFLGFDDALVQSTQIGGIYSFMPSSDQTNPADGICTQGKGIRLGLKKIECPDLKTLSTHLQPELKTETKPPRPK